MNFEETINKIKEEIGDEAYAKASNEFADILTAHKSTCDDNSAKQSEIETLKQEKEDLVKANAKLFQRLGFEDNTPQNFENGTREEEKHELVIGDIINEKGEII